MTTDTLTQSDRLLRRASLSIPGGVNTAKRRPRPQVCVRQGEGGYIEDLDGRRLIDHHAAYGAVLLGHGYPPQVRRVAEAIERGVLYGLGVTEAETELAEKIVAHVPCAERVLLCGSGSEATFHALRVARAVTGRAKIVKFQGAYHGFHDYVARNYLSREPFSAGVLEAALDETLVCEFNDLASVERAFEQAVGEVAAIITEPIVQNEASLMPRPGCLQGLGSR